MADITAGRLTPDKNVVGGLRAVYFVNDGDCTGVQYNSSNTDVIETVTGNPSAYKYDLKGANSFEQTVVSSRENGTTFYEQNLKLTLPKLTVKDHNELKLLTYGKPQVIVEDNNGNFFFCGLNRGMEVVGGTIVTGTNLGDASGYTLELKGEEPIAANFILTDLQNGGLENAGFTIVLGT